MILRMKSRMPIGKYEGLTMEEIVERDHNYIRWFKDNVKRYTISQTVWAYAVSIGITESEARADRFGTASDWGFPEY